MPEPNMNRRMFFRRLMIGYLAGIGLCAGCTGPEEEISKALTEASQLVQTAQEEEQTSYAAARKFYLEALTKAESVISQHPASPLVEKLTWGEARIGPYTLPELKDLVVQRIEMQAQ